MPKFVSKLVKEEVQLGNGRIKPGVVALIGLNDAAIVSPLHAAAIAAGHHVPKNPNEVKEAQARLDAAEAKENKRRGIGA